MGEKIIYNIARTLGKKGDWQEYPCIIAYSNDYALIAFNEEEGELVDKEGNTVIKGKPLDIGESKKYDIDIVNAFIFDTKVHYEINKFWKSKYPEYIKGQKGDV